MSLTVITVVAYDGKSGLADFMVRSVRKFTNPGAKLIICNHGDCQRFITKYNDKAWVRVIKNNANYKDSSTAHGSGLNRILPLVETEFTAIVEPDCIVCDHDWWKFDVDKYDMRAPLKGIGSNDQRFYHPCFMVFKTDVLRGIDFLSGVKGEEVGIIRDGTNYADVGWRITNHIDQSRIEELEVKRCSAGQTKYFRHTALEYKTCEFWLGGNPIAAHFYRGSDSSRRATVGNIAYGAQRAVWKSIVEDILHDKTSEEIITKHKQENIKELKRRIVELQRQLNDLEIQEKGKF